MSTQAIDDVASAEQEFRDADELVGALEERVRAGDESVTADELERARGLSRFAVLRKDAAVRKRAQQEAQAKADALEGLRAEMLALRSVDRPDRDAVVAGIRKLVTDYAADVRAYDAKVSDIVGRLQSDAGVERGQPSTPGTVYVNSSENTVHDRESGGVTKVQGSEPMRRILEKIVTEASKGLQA